MIEKAAAETFGLHLLKNVQDGVSVGRLRRQLC